MIVAFAARARSAGTIVLVFALGFGAAPLRAQAPARPPSLLARSYREGDSLHYLMNARNQGVAYSARADGAVRRDSLGRFVEELEWSDLVQDGRAVPLAAGTRQRLTLAPELVLPPDVAHTNPRLIGPVLDLFTFYVDLWLAAKLPLAQAGAHLRVPGQGSASWADGRSVVIGEDAVDFDITLESVDSVAHRARLLVRHVPPTGALVRFPAEWMRAPVFDTPNNWVEVTRRNDTTFVAGVGRETFDDVIEVDLRDGGILAATMENPVDYDERVCRDAALTACGAAVRSRILRHVEVRRP